MQNRLVFIFLLIFLFLPKTVIPSTANKIYSTYHQLEKGVFLVASEALRGPYFRNSVVLLAQYSNTGAVGVIINRPTNISLSDVLPDVKGLDKKGDTLFVGGPVSRYLPFLLLQSSKQNNKYIHNIFNDVYFSLNLETIKETIENKKKKEKMRIYAGYAGWAPGQLEAEVSRGSWIILKADQYTIFDKKPETLWEDLIRGGSQLYIKKFGKSLNLG